MLPINKTLKRLSIFSVMLLLLNINAKAQTVTPPVWWFGLSGAANANFYDGTTQTLGNSLVVPTAFHKGNGVRPYGSLFVEYRPKGVWGGMLNVAYDGRGAKFDDEVAPCNCPALLSVNTSYVAVEPSLRVAVPKSGLYFFTGPTIEFNVTKDFAYSQFKQPDTHAQLSNMQSVLLAGQVGAGYDIRISKAASTTQVNLSPFVSYHPYFGFEPRNIESWNITTVRAGIAIKFGKAHKVAAAPVAAAAAPIAAVVPPEREVAFNVRAPLAVPAKRQVSETLPLLSVVFFDESSTNIPSRYILLTRDQATTFTEVSLQKESNVNMTGRSARQLNVYHNVLNILGDRLRANPSATITLTGASAAGAKQGAALAESVKLYLVNVFGIDAARIAVINRAKPLKPSEQPGIIKDLALLHAEDTRVDIGSTSPALLIEVGGGMMRPVQFMSTQVDPLDSHVIFNVDGAKDLLQSWSVIVTDSNGGTQQYGPYTADMASIPGSTILGNNPTGDYKVTLVETTKNGSVLKKESNVHLIKQQDNGLKALRYSIVFDFDKAQTIESYNKFLTTIVTPLISDGSTVIIHGHTDIIGDDEYNQKLSDSRAKQTQAVLQRAISASGKQNITFETLGFGKDANHSPFDNSLPEERFYNRTVIIDIIPVK